LWRTEVTLWRRSRRLLPSMTSGHRWRRAFAVRSTTQHRTTGARTVIGWQRLIPSARWCHWRLLRLLPAARRRRRGISPTAGSPAIAGDSEPRRMPSAKQVRDDSKVDGRFCFRWTATPATTARRPSATSGELRRRLCPSPWMLWQNSHDTAMTWTTSPTRPRCRRPTRPTRTPTKYSTSLNASNFRDAINDTPPSYTIYDARPL